MTKRETVQSSARNSHLMRRNFFRSIPARKSNVSRRVLWAFLASLFLGVVIFADEQSIVFDDQTDFSKLRTFAIGEGKCDSARPELNNPLYMKRLAETIRTGLTAKGMKETADNPDILVNYHIDGIEVSTADRPSERLLGGVIFIRGTITVDLVRRDSKLLLWKGIYRDDEKNGPKLAQSLPSDIKKLLAQYPPRK
jgi:hypothetical protein